MQARALESVEVVANEIDSNEKNVSVLLDHELFFIGGGSPVVNAL